MVRVTSDRKTYWIRDKALVRVTVWTAAGQLPPAGSEVVGSNQHASCQTHSSQATLTPWQRELKQPIQRPADALPDGGGVQLLVRPSFVEGIDAMCDRMRRYPYACLEQQISRTVPLRDQGQWEHIAAILPSSLDPDGLLKYFPGMVQGSEVLTPYVLSIVHESGRTIPDETRERMIQGLQRFVEGTSRRRPSVVAVDLPLRKLSAIAALSRYTAVNPQVLMSITIEPNLWPTSAVLDWWHLLPRVPGIRHRESELRQAVQIVRAAEFAGHNPGIFQ